MGYMHENLRFFMYVDYTCENELLRQDDSTSISPFEQQFKLSAKFLRTNKIYFNEDPQKNKNVLFN